MFIDCYRAHGRIIVLEEFSLWSLKGLLSALWPTWTTVIEWRSYSLFCAQSQSSALLVWLEGTCNPLPCNPCSSRNFKSRFSAMQDLSLCARWRFIFKRRAIVLLDAIVFLKESIVSVSSGLWRASLADLDPVLHLGGNTKAINYGE